MNKKTSLILSIETSCDETAAAVLSVNFSQKNKKSFPTITSLSSVIKSQIKLHSTMGGVVPEVAARAHVKNILPVVQHALQATGYQLTAMDYIAVTTGPGLIPSLIVGVEFAKALSLATGKPVIPVNHMLGHLYSPWGQIERLNDFKIENYFPQIALIVSGGHTMLVLIKDIKNYKVLGQTVDDAAGEAFDKVAKLLKLPYPGGPEVSKLAAKGQITIEFPRPMIHSSNYDFSFSGLKTAVLYYMRDFPGTRAEDICASFQEAAIDVLVTKTLRAAKQFKAKSLSLSGGVSANKALRERLSLASKKAKITFLFPSAGLRTDNAEMIGLAAAFQLSTGYKPKNFASIKADSNLSL